MSLLADMGRAAAFLAFVFLAVRAGRGMSRSESERRRSASILLLFTVAISMGAGFAQRSLWPFSHWPMDNKFFEAETPGLLTMVVDQRGAEPELDFRALYPIDWMDLYDWLNLTERGNPAAFDQVAPWLLDRISNARAALEATGRMPGDRGLLAAPSRLVVLPVWTADDGRSPLQVDGLRFYEFQAHLDEPAAFPTAEQRRLVFEYSRP